MKEKISRRKLLLILPITLLLSSIWLNRSTSIIAQNSNSNNSPTATPVVGKKPIKVLKVNRHRKGMFGILPSMVDSYDYTVFYFENPDYVTLGGGLNLGKRLSNVFYEFSISFGFNNRGKKLIKPSFIELGIVAAEKHKGCIYKDTNSLFFKINDSSPEKVEVVTSWHTDDYGKGKCRQGFRGKMSYELFAKIATATNGVITFGPKTFKLKDGDLKTISEINKAIGVY